MTEQIPLDKLARVYRKIRTKIQDMTKVHEEAVGVLEQQRDEIAAEMKDRMLASGLKSVRTDEGTIMLGIKVRYSTQDWDSFKKFVIEHEAVELLERRIAQGNMKQFLEENPTLLPPGLNSDSEYAITVRKPTTR